MVVEVMGMGMVQMDDLEERSCLHMFQIVTVQQEKHKEIYGFSVFSKFTVTRQLGAQDTMVRL